MADDQGQSLGAGFPRKVREAIQSGTPVIQALREWRGYPVAQLAERAGLDEIVVAQLEDGAFADAHSLRAVADALSVDVEKLLA